MFLHISRINKINSLSVIEQDVIVKRMIEGRLETIRVNSQELVLGDIVVVESNQL